jgi:hypothetical protein
VIRRLAVVPLLVAVLVLAGSMRPAQAGVSETVMALAGPLAEQFGVPKAAVSTLLDGGLSLDSVTKLLLVSQSSDKGLDDVTKLFNASGKDIDKTAGELDVKPDAYSQSKVDAAIAAAQKTAQDEASKSATEEAGKALDSALGGMMK